MKLFTSIVCLSLFLVAGPSLTMADEKGVYVFPQIAAPEYADASDLRSEAVYCLGAGYRFVGPVALEADFHTGDTSPKRGGGDADVDVWSIRALYHFLESENFHPFVSLGFGEQEVALSSADSEDQVNAGLGIRWKLWNNLDGRAAFNFYDGNRDALLKRTFNVGLVYRFASSEPPRVVQSKPADSDGDGVIDSQDRCLGTPSGISVDARGCRIRLDGDGDGVVDARDRCPQTTDRSRNVDRFGCYVKTQVKVSDEMRVTFLFDFDSAAIKSEHRASARNIANFLRGGKDTRIRLNGHTDAIGASEYNQGLSERRATAVKKLLVETLNVPAGDIAVRGFGEDSPEVSPENSANRRFNRRVEATVKTQRTRSR